MVIQRLPGCGLGGILMGAMGVKNLRLNPYGSVDFATSLRNVEPGGLPSLVVMHVGAASGTSDVS